MKTQRQTAVLGVLALLYIASPAFAAEGAAADDGVVRETRTDSVFKGAMYRVWGRLRALSPKADIEEAARGKVIVTAGIRGAETTETALKPYWKDDRGNDAQYRRQLEAYTAAQALIEKGELKAAAVSLDKFMDEYPDSELMPNAVFAEAMALAGMGEKDASLKQFNRFIKDNPNHPLRADAEVAVKELGAAR